MNKQASLLVTLLLTASSPAAMAAGLPDSGQTLCDDGTNTLVTCDNSNSGDASTMPRQDGRFGHDPAADAGAVSKVGGGEAGFDYTTISALECVQDNITGLMWEVKTTDSGLRDQNWTYSWFSDASRGDDTANELNAGDAGTENSGICYNQYDVSTNAAGDFCDTAGYVAAVNTANFCGYSDWRLPSRRELKSIVHFGTSSPVIESSYFPNTVTGYFYSASSQAANPGSAWHVRFDKGGEYSGSKSSSNYVRLVRGVQF